MNRDFETELREDLAVIKTKQQSNSESLGVFLEKTQTQEVELKTVENNIKTIFKRLDEMRAEAKENKVELNKYLRYNRISEDIAIAALKSDAHYRNIASPKEPRTFLICTIF